jgi:hypothetical protein
MHKERLESNPPQPPLWPIGWGVAIIAFTIYFFSLAPTVLEADSGEFQFVAWLPGIAHPTGYPLYVLLGWLWSHLWPVGEVAWRMNLLSALLAAATVALIFDAARRFFELVLPETPATGRSVAAAATALTVAVTPTFWSQAIIAEVYPLHALFVSLILGLTFATGQSGLNLAGRPAHYLSLSLGLSLTHHRTIVLLWPALALYLGWLYRRNSPPQRGPQPGPQPGRHLVRHLGLLLTPLLLYLYLPLIAPVTPYATINLSEQQQLILYDNTLRGLREHLMGTVFRAELRPAAATFERLALAWQLLQQQFGWAGLLLALAGVGTLLGRGRLDLLLLTFLSALAFVLFNLVYFIGDVFVLFIPVWIIVALWVGLGGLSLAHGLAHNFTRGKAGSQETPIFGQLARRLVSRLYRLILVSSVSLLFLLPLILFARWQATVSQADNLRARERWQQILAEPLPPQSILLSNDRNEIMPLWYYQYVEQRRPDLQGLFPLIVPEPAYANVGRVLEQALASGRPVFLIKPMAGLAIKADLTAVGSLYRASPIALRPSQPLQVTLPAITVTDEAGQPRSESIGLSGYDLAPAEPKAGQVLTVTLYWQASQPLSIDYTSFVHLLDTTGQRLSQSDHQPGQLYHPSRAWQPGEVVRDQHRLTLPLELPAGSYQLRSGLYYQPQPGVIAGMGNGEIIGSVRISRY